MSSSCSTVCWASPAAHSVALLTALTDRHRKRNHHLVKTKKIWSVVSFGSLCIKGQVEALKSSSIHRLLNPAFLHTLTYLSVSLFFMFPVWRFFYSFLTPASPSSHTHGVLDLSLMAVCLSFATFSHCTASSYPLYFLSAHAGCDFVQRVSDRWQVAQISPRQGVTSAKCCLSRFDV